MTDELTDDVLEPPPPEIEVVAIVVDEVQEGPMPSTHSPLLSHAAIGTASTHAAINRRDDVRPVIAEGYGNRLPMDRAPLITALVVWAALRMFFYVGYYMEDAPGFVADAVSWASGSWEPRTNLPGLRIGTYIPAGIAISLLGKTELALSLWPLASSLAGTLALIGICSRLQIGRWSLLAAGLWAAYPGDVIFSTVLMPDAIQTGWFLVATWLALAGCTGRWRTAALLASGAVFGFTYLVRENAVILAPVLVTAPLLLARDDGDLRSRLRKSGLILAGLAAIVASEAVYYGLANGTPGLRFTVSHAYYGGAEALNRHGLNADPWTIPGSLLPPLEWLRIGMPWGSLHPGQAYHAYAFVLGLLAWCAGLLVFLRMGGSERRAFLWMSIWAWWPVLYHQFGSQSLTSFVPIHRLPRQLILYAPAAITLVAWTGAHLTRHRAAHPRVAAIASIGLAMGLLVHASGISQGLRLQSAMIGQTTTIYDRLIANLAGYRGRIYIDSAEVGLLDYFLNPLGVEPVVRAHDIFSAPSCAAFEGAIVVTHSNPGWSFSPAPVLLDSARQRLPCLEQPPPTWKQIQGAPWLRERIYTVSPASPVAQNGGS